MAVTLDTIAEEAGLHKATISRILSGTYTGSKDTRERVKALAEKLGYTPNLLARSMRTGALPVVLLFASPDPYTSAYVHKLTVELAERNLGIITTYRSEAFTTMREHLKPVASVIFGPRHIESHTNLFKEKNIIIINGDLTETSREYYTINVDFKGGFNHLVTRLYLSGCRHFAYIGSTSDSDITAGRYSGFTEGLLPRAEEITTVRIDSDTPGSLENFLNQCSKTSSLPVAVVCGSDTIACNCIFTCARLGLSVPDEVTITGCDGITITLGDESLSTLTVPHALVARRVADWITEEIMPTGDTGGSASERAVQVELEFRQGTTSVQI